MKQRGFEIVRDDARKHKDITIQLPVRATKNSAGYDFFATEKYTFAEGDEHTFWTDIKAYMLDDEVLKIYIRSSLGMKHNLVVKNTTGIIDADYYSNKNNDGNIGICIKRMPGSGVYTIQPGEKIAQGIFSKFLKTDNDNTTEERIGGIGSTNNDICQSCGSPSRNCIC